METTLNGQPFTFEAQHDECALEVIREQAKLTGTKLACGAGVCGACTVLLDGIPVTSCLLPAHALAGRTVQTIEGAGPNLHPVQRAFMACDALQCGFCTPGFINGGIAFYNTWRAEHGHETPSRDDIAQAMAGHLCRCGAYIGIYEAIQAACAGKYDDDKVDYASPRVEAIEKVTGRAKYTVDIQYDHQLEGKILRSIHPHAKISTIDISAAAGIPGVKAIVELLDKDRTVRYIGQEILAVAATNHRIAEEALAKIKVTYETLPAVIGLDAARAADAPAIFTGLLKNAPSAAEGVLVPGKWHGNVRQPIVSVTSSKAGQARKHIEAAQATDDPKLVTGTWHTSPQLHTCLEPHACVANWEGGNRLVVHLSTQACHKMSRDIAKHYKLPEDNVQVLCNHIGGAFGSKLGLTEETKSAIELSRKTRQPVRVAFDRLEELTVGGYRPEGEIELALLADDEGKMAALKAKTYADSGIGIGSIIAAPMGFIYPGAPKDLVDCDVVNNMAPGKPFRGPGGPLAAWALEQAIDEMGYTLNKDPVALRREWDPDPLRQKLYDWAETIPAWQERAAMGADKGRYRRGIGLAVGHWFYFFHGKTEVEVSTGPEGITAKTATQDMGNGSRTVIAEAVAEVFDISPRDVNVQIGNSNFVRGPLSGGSRTTSSIYGPARKASKEVRDKLLETAQSQFGLQNPKFGSGGIDHNEGHLPWSTVFQEVSPVSAIATRGRDRGLPAMPIAFGADDLNTGRGTAGAIHITELEIDTRLGKIRPLRVWGGLAVGRIFSHKLALSQCYGAIIQGLGYALYEERQIDPRDGLVLSVGLEDYRIPAIGDIPEIEMFFLEEGFEHAWGKGVGLGEIATVAIAASVGNAVYHATGWRPYKIPIRPQYIIEEVR